MQIAALAGLIVLCVYLILTLTALKKTFVTLEKEVSELSAAAKPVLKNLEVVTEKTRLISEKLEEQVQSVAVAFSGLRRIVENVVHFQQRLENIIEQPLMRVAGIANAVISSVGGIFDVLRSRRDRSPS